MENWCLRLDKNDALLAKEIKELKQFNATTKDVHE